MNMIVPAATPFDSIAITETVIQQVGQTLTAYIKMKGEQDVWMARIDHVKAVFEKHGQSEQFALEDRRLRTDLARFAIAALASDGNAQAIVDVFRDYNSNGYDFLGKVVSTIDILMREQL